MTLCRTTHALTAALEPRAEVVQVDEGTRDEIHPGLARVSVQNTTMGDDLSAKEAVRRRQVHDVRIEAKAITQDEAPLPEFAVGEATAVTTKDREIQVAVRARSTRFARAKTHDEPEVAAIERQRRRKVDHAKEG
jgi:hypothetical protein